MKQMLRHSNNILFRYHIPRILAVCILVFGLSGVLTGLPHFYLQEKMPHFNSSHTNSSDMKNKSVLCIEGTSDFTGKVNTSMHDGVLFSNLNFSHVDERFSSPEPLGSQGELIVYPCSVVVVVVVHNVQTSSTMILLGQSKPNHMEHPY